MKILENEFGMLNNHTCIHGTFVIDKLPEVHKYQKALEYAQKHQSWLYLDFEAINTFSIEEVIFHDPATIVYWRDGTKTVVKCGKDDIYNKETGLALCFMKKALGNEGNYNNIFKKYIKEN